MTNVTQGPMKSSTIQSMAAALAEEVQAIKKKGGSLQLPLTAGELDRREGDVWIYRFPLRSEYPLRDDAAVSLRIGDEVEASGYIVSFQGGVLMVAVTRDCGPTIPSAKLVVDDSFLVARLRERLLEVLAGKVTFQLASAERVVAGKCKPLVMEAPHSRVFLDGRLNKEQQDVVRRALGSDLCYLWGPPGTGKTTTLARLVEAHLRAGRSVLLVSNTNVAVDTALAKVCEQLAGEELFELGQVLRWGPIVLEQLRSGFGPKVDLEQVCARIGKLLAEERDRLEGELRSERQVSAAAQSAVDALLAVAALEDECRSRRSALAQIEKDQGARVAQIEQLKLSVAAGRENLTRAGQLGAIRRWLSGLDPKRVQARIDQDQAKLLVVEGAVAEGVRKLEEAQGAVRSKEAQVVQLRSKVPPGQDLTELRARLAAVLGGIKQKEARLAEVRGQLDGIRDSVLKNCRVLATTVYRTYAGPALPRLFDVVVIDEASMLMLPLSFYAAGLATKAVTVAGDFRQLPPIVQSDSPEAALWLRRDVFAAAGIPESLEQGSRHPGLVSLREQFRMRPEICEVINELFYRDHPLVTAAVRRVEQADSPPLLRDLGGLLFVDTGPLGVWATHPAGKWTRYNLLHAMLVRNLVVEMARSGYLPADPGQNTKVGVVAPYAAQTGLIDRLLESALGRQGDDVASTVHRFQGNERSVIVFDLTDAPGVRLGKFLRATTIDEDGGRLLNVALSRARDHVIVVGDFQFLTSKAPRGSYLSRLLALVKEKGRAMDARSILPLGHAVWIDGLKAAGRLLQDLPADAAGVFHEAAFYEAFPQDLARAQKSIVLFSPFVTVAGVGRWVDHLRAAVARGVSVRLLCKPPEEFGGGSTEDVTQALARLRSQGIAVDLRAKMHEKIAILDGEVLWHGSLNVLSHSNTTESMLRLRAPGVCQELAKLITGQRGGAAAAQMERGENPECPLCSASTVRKTGRTGTWYECAQACGGKTDAQAGSGGRGRRTPVRARSMDLGPCPSPGCRGMLRVRSGRFGAFVGCSAYPRCTYTRDLAEEEDDAEEGDAE